MAVGNKERQRVAQAASAMRAMKESVLAAKGCSSSDLSVAGNTVFVYQCVLNFLIGRKI